jgi:hypothetical protein
MIETWSSQMEGQVASLETLVKVINQQLEKQKDQLHGLHLAMNNIL